jgi:hypothetical protein
LPQEAFSAKASSPSGFAPEGAIALSGVDLRAHESGLRGPVGGCGFGDVGETDAVLKRKTVAKVKFGNDFPGRQHLPQAGTTHPRPEMETAMSLPRSAGFNLHTKL